MPDLDYSVKVQTQGDPAGAQAVNAALGQVDAAAARVNATTQQSAAELASITFLYAQ